MDRFYVDCLERFGALHKEIKNSLQDLDQNAFDWRPADETNSISVLVTHLAAAEVFWAVEIARGREPSRVREEEFLAKGLDGKDLVSILDSALESIQAAFEQMSLSDLGQIRHSKAHQMDVSAGWAILHALEHTAIHVGHIQLTVQFWKEYQSIQGAS